MMAMQRLIDANKLQSVEKKIVTGTSSAILRVYEFNEIRNAPTVDAVPVVHGYWVKATGVMPPEYFGKHVCSVCDSFAPNRFNSMFEWLSKVCPSCGAKMDGKGW